MRVKKAVAALLGVLMATPLWAGQAEIDKGKSVVYTRTKGNCISCHMIPGGNLPGNYGPPLIQMKTRFPDRELLRQQIYDARSRNPYTIMPPFGAHKMLTDEEIDWLIEYLYTL